MKVETRYLTAGTRGHSDVVDLTEQLAQAIRDSGLSAGTATLFVSGSTASLSTIEFEPGAVEDLEAALERIAPEGADYRHHLTWGDDNGSAHVRACLMGPSLVVPFRDGRPLLGTWQQVVLVDFDTRPRDRRIVAQLMGE
jgi:secondary thiamine-phosphate synthase enzyme